MRYPATGDRLAGIRGVCRRAAKDRAAGRLHDASGEQFAEKRTRPQPAAGAKAISAEKEQKVVLESKGYIIAAHQILVSPKVSGTCTRLTIEEGSRVKKGDILAEIEDVDYRTDYERCVGEFGSAKQKLLELERGNRPEEISQAKAQLQEAEAQLTQLEADWNRMQQLRKNNVATAADFDATRSKYWAMQRQVERLRVRLLR